MKRIQRRLKWRAKPWWLKSTYWLNRIVERLTGGRVAQGPFAGLRYIPGQPGNTYMPQLLGTYERELHGTVRDLCEGGFDKVINVGAAEGHYALGFHATLPDAHIVAFEADAQGRARLKDMAALNSVKDGTLSIRGQCSPGDLETEAAVSGKCLIVMDVDGGEEELLDPAKVPSLLRAHVLVELHPHFVPGIDSLTRKRFAATHTIEAIGLTSRSYADLPPAPALLRPLLMRATREHRPSSQLWFLMQPHGSADAPV